MINEEMFFVLEGNGELRVGDATHPVRAGDIIACRPEARKPRISWSIPATAN